MDMTSTLKNAGNKIFWRSVMLSMILINIIISLGTWDATSKQSSVFVSQDGRY